MARVACLKRADWQALYHHPVHLLERFVGTDRFQGTCYRAAVWIFVCSRSEGRGTKSKSKTVIVMEPKQPFPGCYCSHTNCGSVCRPD